jgi:hypothetical protein
MPEKILNGFLKVIFAIAALNLAIGLLLELMRQHPFLMFFLFCSASIIAYCIIVRRRSEGGRSSRSGGNERTPLVPRGGEE